MADVAGTNDPPQENGVELLRDGRYAVTGILGEGSQGQTLEAVDKRDGQLVAIKRFAIKGANSWKGVELAEREARVLSRLSHPGLPRYIEHFEEEGALYLVMEKVEGSTVRELSKSRSLDQHGVVRLLNDMADVLDYLHQLSPPIIHRDIKPNNIILRPDGSFALVDFGSVRDCLRPEGGSTVVGTFGYMAPEQFQGRALPASDIYGVGATALAVLTGQEPDQLPHQGLALDVPKAVGGQVDGRISQLLHAMLVPDPDARAPHLATLLSTHRLRLTEHQSRPETRVSSQAFQSHAEQARPRWRAPSSKAKRRGQASFLDAWVFGNSFVVPLLLLALELAKLAVWALFSVCLPVLFGVLSIFLGRRLRRAAVRIDAVGEQGRQAMSRLSEELSERADSAAATRHQRRLARRVRVQAKPRQRVSASFADEQDAFADEPLAKESDAKRR